MTGIPVYYHYFFLVNKGYYLLNQSKISVDYCMVSEKKDLGKKVRLKESYIPGLIIWVPIISIILTAFIVSSLFIISYNKFLQVENINLRDKLLEDSRILIKNEVNEVINYIDFNISSSEKWLVEELKNRVDMSYSIINSIYEYNSKNKSKEEIIDIIRETFRNIRFFDGRGYYFIHRHDLNSSDYTILQPNLPQLEGNHQLDEKDLDGKLISESAYNLLESFSEGYLSFYFYLDNQNEKEKKLAYVKLFEPLDIFIGTGEYLYYFEEKIKKEVLLWLENYSFGSNNYIFIYNISGTILMHPVSSELVNKNIGNIKDSSGYEFGKEYLKSSRSESGVYVKYIWPSPDTGEEILKIGYAQLHKDWDWNIATGIYMNHLEDVILEGQNNLGERIKTVTIRTVLIVGFLILAVFIVTLIFAKFTASLFGMYNRHIKISSDELNELNFSLENKIREKTSELEKKNRELEQIATIDSLTNIYNRRYFDFIFNKEWYRHMRNKREMALIMCDIDFFKQYNDAYGHQKGDDCLEIVGNIVKKICKRPTDIPVRYGGEEFALILPQTDLDGAVKIAIDVQNEINAHNILHESSSVSNIITFSFGVSSVIPEIDTEYSLLIKSADEALYRAKTNGRNRIES